MNNKILCIIENKLLYSNKLLLKIISILYTSKAADIILIPNINHINFVIYNYYNNIHLKVNKDEYLKMIMIIKLACRLNIIDIIPQTTSIPFIAQNIKYFLRVSIHPTNTGERCAFRFLRDDVFLSNHIVSQILDQKGLVIIAGRTCSGKTTLLYSCITKFKGNCITLEDPVEYAISSVSQTDVSNIGYDEGIKSALRQNPDLICIGEIRDEISASAVIRATLTGHNVITTLHAISADHVYTRLSDLKAKYINECISAIVYCNNFQYQFVSI